MNSKIRKQRNNPALRIPTTAAVKPVKKRKLSLARLLKGVTKENCHSEIGWGAPVGREIWQ